MNKPIDRLLYFELVGSIAQFRKYYSNISALTYEIPPRTVIAGILASVLELPRDSYYETFNHENSKFTVQVLSGLRKYMAYTNYRNPKEGATIQTRVELLFPKPVSEYIRYGIFCWHKDQYILNQLADRLNEGHTGYGVYLGQRQFRASIQNLKLYKSSELDWEKNYQGTITSATFSENIVELEEISGCDIISSSMPLNMKKVDDGREPISTGDMIYEITGQGLTGQFKEVLQLPDQHIAFLSSFKA